MMSNQRALLPLLLLLAVFATSACDLDLQDPNRPTEDEVFRSPEGIQQVAIGMQATYADYIRNPIWVVGLVSDEIGAGQNTFQDYVNLDTGEEVRPGYYNTAPFDPWYGEYKVVKLANDVLQATPTSAGMGAATQSGLLAVARLYKAMALGHLVQLYERIPLDVGPDKNPPFVDRATALAEILQLLQDARQQIQTTPPSDVFNKQVLAPGLDLANTIDAMTARYALIAGQYDVALAAAQRVNPNVLSVLQYSATDPNALWNLWYNSGNAYQMRPEQGLRLQAEPGDGRVAYWVVADTIKGAVQRLDELNQYRDRADAIPVYLPDEMRLIQAEVYARTGRLAEARTQINAVRTQCTSVVDEPLACLPALTEAELATEQQILDEILRQRRYELFLQGLRYEDLRRFGKPIKFPWMPVPLSECTRNPNAGC